MTKAEAIVTYDNALRSTDSEAKSYATIAKYLATLSDAKRAEYLRLAPSVAQALKAYA